MIKFNSLYINIYNNIVSYINDKKTLFSLILSCKKMYTNHKCILKINQKNKPPILKNINATILKILNKKNIYKNIFEYLSYKDLTKIQIICKHIKKISHIYFNDFIQLYPKKYIESSPNYIKGMLSFSSKICNHNNYDCDKIIYNLI